MKHLAIAMALLCIVAFIACNSKTEAQKETTVPTTNKEDLVKRGEYLVKITGCNDCHSPKKPGPHGPELISELLLSGHAQNSPAPKGDKALSAQGFSIFAPDLTAAAGPWRSRSRFRRNGAAAVT